MDILKLMPRSLPSSDPGSIMMSVTIFTVRKDFSSRKNNATITIVARIDNAEPCNHKQSFRETNLRFTSNAALCELTGTVPSVKSL